MAEPTTNRGTTITYNGVILQNVLTRDFEHSIRYDQSGTDKVGEVFNIGVEATVHLSDSAEIGWSERGHATLSAKLQAMLTKLAIPRRDFEFAIDSVTVLAGNTSNDSNNGPRPLAVKFLGITGASSARVAFRIEHSRTGCESYDSGQGLSTRVINNRWSVTESYDQSLAIRRSVSGSLRLSKAATTALDFRGAVVPPLVPGFRRESISITQSRTQLDLDYQIVDVQKHAAPPWPATDWECTHAVVFQDGAFSQQQVNVKLTGAPHVNRRDIVLAATATAQRLVGSFGDISEKGGRIISAAVIDDVSGGSATVQVTVQGRELESCFNRFILISGRHLDDTFARSATDSTSARFIQNYDHNKWPTLVDIGYPGSGAAFAQYLQEPCTGSHDITGAAASKPEYSNDASGAEVTVYEGDKSQHTTPEKRDVNEKNDDGLYTNYTLDSHYSTRKNIAQVPYAAFPNEESDDCAFFTLTRPMTQRVVKIVAERHGNWPALPNFGDDEPRGPLLEYDIMPSAPDIDAGFGKVKLFRVEAKYVFGYAKTLETGEPLSVGLLPWINGEVDEMPTEFESRGLIY